MEFNDFLKYRSRKARYKSAVALSNMCSSGAATSNEYVIERIEKYMRLKIEVAVLYLRDSTTIPCFVFLT